MRKKIAALSVACLLAVPTTFAATQGINPAAPNLFTVTTAAIWGGNIANNQGSAMCMDCHSQTPKTYAAPLGGTHFTAAAAGTNSGGSGINNTGAAAVRENGEYFRLADWSTIDSDANVTSQAGGRHSKYYDPTAGRSKMVSNTNNLAAAAEVAGATYAAYEIICESCHNVIVNDKGGNLLLANTNSGTNTVASAYTSAPASSLCVGCHGFLYTANAENATSPANANYADARNTPEIGAATKRDNNAYHWVWDPAKSGGAGQAPFKQNHHVMTGDNIDNVRANAFLLWTDNRIVSYTRAGMNLTAQGGSTYPALSASWTVPAPSNSTWVNCTNCHMPGHGGDLSEGASILRNVTGTSFGGGGTTSLSRLAAGSTPAFGRGGYKAFNDAGFCNQCH